ncbi:MAG: hypothetical protein M3P18_07975 [Actinomycetota bacterium]|nr:hypothetical protein [Actinomycetota bacterium]
MAFKKSALRSVARAARGSAREHTNAVAVLTRAPLIVSRPRVVAADRQHDALFQARAALRRAVTLRETADTQVRQLRELVERLEAERRAAL